MRRFLASILLCAFFVQSSAQAGTERETDASVNGVAIAATAQIAQDFLANLRFLMVAGPRIAASVEPATMPTPPPRSQLTPVITPRIAPPPGIRVTGPPTPYVIDAKHAPKDPLAMQGAAIRKHNGLHALGRLRALAVDSTVAPITGINRWWTYDESALAGVGKSMFNIGTGNLILQTADVDIPERGIDLAFQRTFNSFSKHDYVGTDGSQVSNYGNGWTNTFDARIAFNTGNQFGQGISVYDIDGARYDYLPDGAGHWIPPAGQFAKLYSDGGWGEYWEKKSGTRYKFWLPNLQAGNEGFAGRLISIEGRNHNNSIQFAYSFDGPTTSSSTLNKIVAQHSDGQSLTLSFANFNGRRLLASLTRPDGVSTLYDYDPNGNLSVADEPTNNIGTALRQGYTYIAGTNQLSTVQSPRWSASAGTDGGYTFFNYNADGRLASATETGVVNFAPTDGTGALLQPGIASGVQTWRSDNYTYVSGGTFLRDTDGHQINWAFDSSGRVNVADTFASGSTWLRTINQVWDANNNLTASIDPRGIETDYAYDANGNTIEVAGPSVTNSQGTFRPTTLFSYDSNNNITAHCDPVTTHARGGDWVSGPHSGDNSCAPTAGATVYTWDFSDANEPFGKLTDTYTPLGYHARLAYDSGPQGGDFGLPTSVTPDSFRQTDGSTMAPSQTFTYDLFGDLVQYQKSIGNGQLGTATMTYDTLHRLTMATDPDGYSSCKSYFPNGQVSASESAAQHAALGGSAQCNPASIGAYATTFTYDADGNEKSEIKHFNQGAGVTSPSPNAVTDKWYDGADRLVEVASPWDSADQLNHRDYYNFRWMTRYIYDLSQGGTVSAFNGQKTLAVHGNLATTQEYVCAAAQSYTIGQGNTNCPAAWTDLKGYSYDLLDRPTAKIVHVGTTLQTNTSTYDGTAPNGDSQAGLLSQSCDALNECAQSGYDHLGEQTSLSFTHPASPTPNRTYTFDADGRVVGINSTQFGTQGYSYDADGRMLTSTEPSGGGVTSPATLTYSYYPNGMRSGLSVNSSGLKQANLFRYAYRNDGAINAEYFADGGVSTALSFTRQASGRMLSRSENTSGSAPYSESLSYDTYGRLNSQTMPSGQITGLAYDAEGEKTFEVYNNGGGGSSSITYGYNIRGERLSSLFNTSMSANGFMIGTRNGMAQTPSTGFSAYMGVMTSQTANPNTLSETDSTWGFDAAGRQGGANIGYFTSGGQPANGTVARSFDAENHLVGQIDNIVPLQDGKYSVPVTIALGYQWGPNGHPILIGSSASGTTSPITYSTVHWDGDQPLFVTNAGGHVEDVKIGTTADYTPLDPTYSGITFWDRNSSGAQVACHNSSGISGLQRPNEMLLVAPAPCAGLNAAPAITRYGQAKTPLIGHGGILFSPGTDGISDGFNTIQGVRTYDPQFGSWTSPDAYAGNVHDPASQKSYMWNKNNALSYTDPSGYFASYFDPPEGDYAVPIDGESGQQVAAGGSATDAGATAIGMTSADISLMHQGATSGYSSAAGAGYAAADAYTSEANNSQIEYGVPVYQQGNTYGYGSVTKGTTDIVITVTAPPAIPSRSQLVAIWHSHPYRDQTVDHRDDLQKFYDVNHIGFTFFTSVGGEFVHQSVNAKGNISGAVPLCTGCVPQSLLNEGQE